MAVPVKADLPKLHAVVAESVHELLLSQPDLSVPMQRCSSTKLLVQTSAVLSNKSLKIQLAVTDQCLLFISVEKGFKIKKRERKEGKEKVRKRKQKKKGEQKKEEERQKEVRKEGERSKEKEKRKSKRREKKGRGRKEKRRKEEKGKRWKERMKKGKEEKGKASEGD